MDTRKLLDSFNDNPGLYQYDVHNPWRCGLYTWRWTSFYGSEHIHQRRIDTAENRLQKNMQDVREAMPQIVRDLCAVLPAREARVLPASLQKLAKALHKTRTSKAKVKRTWNDEYADRITLIFNQDGLHIEGWQIIENALEEFELEETAPVVGDTFQATINRTAFYELARNYLDKDNRVTFRLGHKSDRLEMNQPGWRVNFRLQEVL